jgi:polysaccharide biosynthesis protein PelE
MNKRQVLCGVVILLEIAALAALLHGYPAQDQAMPLFLSIHSGTSLLLAISAARYGAHHAGASDSHGLRNGSLLFCIAFLVPLIGACIGFAFLGRSLRPPAEEHHSARVRLTASPILQDDFTTRASMSFARGAQMGLADVLKHAKDKERRLKALIAVRELPPRDAIALARLALTDPEDEVRLLAYTMLNVREEALQEDIQAFTDQLAAAAPECRLLFHRALAHTYWETVYLGLASGAMESFMLEAALEHVEAAQRQAPLDAGLRLLLGRIFLRQGKLDRSAMAFSQAQQLGIDASKVTPFLDEIAFIQARSAMRNIAFREVAPDLNPAALVVEAVEESQAYAAYRAAS